MNISNKIREYYLLRIFTIFFVVTNVFFVFGQQQNSFKKSPWAGREVFKDKGCILCHAIKGQGGDEGPDLGESKFYGTYLELAALMWNHVPEMLEKMKESSYEFPEFNNTDEMENLIAYLCYMRFQGVPGREFTGRKLLKSKNCISCHKFGGVGGDIGPDISFKKEFISPIMLVEAMWNHGPNMMKTFEENNIERPSFYGNDIIHIAKAIMSYMTPTKVVVGSLEQGDPENGKILAKEKGCMHCHSFRGSGGTLGPDFDDVELDYSVIEIAGKMWNHEPEMWEAMQKEGIAFPVFSKGEMADVIAYLYELKLKDASGNVEKGSEIISQRGCLSCHSLNNRGADIASDFAELSSMNSPLEMIIAMWNHAPVMREEHREKGLDWPEFSGKDMENLYAYLSSLSSTIRK